jgi:hypothetical protein
MAPAFDAADWPQIALPSADITGKGLRVLRGTFEVADPGAVESLSVAYSLHGSLEAYLNGTRILDVGRGGTIVDMSVMLKPVTRELLRKGANCLAVRITPAPGDENFKLVLKALME